MAAYGRSVRALLKLGAGATAAFGASTGAYIVYAKEQKRYVIFAAPGMEETALKLVRQDPGKHRYLPIKWAKALDGSDAPVVEGVASHEVDGEDVLFLASLTDSNAVLAQYAAMTSICDHVIKSMTVLAPYMPGTVTGDASQTARLLSSLPKTGTPHRIMSYDTRMQCSDSAKVDLYTAAPLLSDMIKKQNFSCVAFGSVEAAAHFKPLLNHNDGLSFVRLDAKEDPYIPNKRTPELMEGDCKGKHVLLVDQVLTDGSGISDTAQILLKKGAVTVSVFATHGVPATPKAWSELASSPSIQKVYITSSNIAARSRVPKDKFDIVDLTPYFLRDI